MKQKTRRKETRVRQLARASWQLARVTATTTARQRAHDRAACSNGDGCSGGGDQRDDEQSRASESSKRVVITAVDRRVKNHLFDRRLTQLVGTLFACDRRERFRRAPAAASSVPLFAAAARSGRRDGGFVLVVSCRCGAVRLTVSPLAAVAARRLGSPARSERRVERRPTNGRRLIVARRCSLPRAASRRRSPPLAVARRCSVTPRSRRQRAPATTVRAAHIPTPTAASPDPPPARAACQ